MDWKAPITAALARDGHADDDVIEELAQHARAMYDAARAEGAPDDEARSSCHPVPNQRWRCRN